MLNSYVFTIKMHINRVILALLLALTVLIISCPLQAKEKVIVWSYYEFPPFVTSVTDHHGLSFDFVEMLNLFVDNNNYEFVLKLVPRKRLDTYLANNNKGIVLWVNPLFFNDAKKIRYHWTNSLLADEQSFISRLKDPFIFKGAISLMKPGFVLGGIRGHFYKGIQDEIDSGLIKRNDVNHEKQNIGMLLTNRVDTFLIPYTAMKYYEKEMKLSDKIYYSPKPLISFTRSIMVNHNLEVFNFLSQTVDSLAKNEYWKALLHQYNLQLTRDKADGL